MKCIALYHTRFEDLGTFAAPLARRGYEITYRHAGATPLSDEQWCDTDLVVILGGPLGAADSARYPWLAGEIAGLTLRLARKRPTLGICLGAQRMAVALGGAVVGRQHPDGTTAKEIGWSSLTIGADAGPLTTLRGVQVLHWHGDNIVLPEHLRALASSFGTPCQAFALDMFALAIQFHAEFDTAALEEWLSGHAVELSQAGIDLHQLREQSTRHGPALARAGPAMLEQWLSHMAAGATRAVEPH